MDFFSKVRNEFGKNYEETTFGRVVSIDGNTQMATIMTSNGLINVPAGANDRVGSKKIIFDTPRGKAYIPF